VSHELRSPLNGIRLWTSLLQDCDPSDRSLVQKAVDNIESSVKSQARIIEDLLDATRFASGNVQFERRPIDLVALTRRVIERNTPAYRECDQELLLDSQVADVTVLADRGRIEQVVQNLIDNARKFSTAGNRTEVRIETTGDRVVVAVRDQGRGIAADELTDLFDQFWQGDRSGDRHQDGLGLGLHIVRHIVELHDGRVEAHSEGRGKGTELRFELPRLDGGAGAARAVAAKRSPEQQAVGDIVVVDDERATAEALALGLRMAGFEVRVAHDVPTALAELEDRRPRALVSDLGIGDRSGFELAHRLREIEFGQRLPRTPAIAISGRDLPEDRFGSRAAGFDDYLRKPVAMRPLVARLRALIDAASQPQQPLDVMIVHGDRDIGERLREQLLGQGHSVRVAGASAEALAQLALQPAAAVLATADLPDGDGASLLAAARQASPHVLPIALAETDDEDALVA
ncbi:MAG: response regulator, partial [Planctomycetes bacterium]|nr:response regulator [Planctomycetota bacterium]